MFPPLLGLFALTGCEGAHWVKPGGTTAELRRGLADCERVATGPTPFHFWALSLSYERARDQIAERRRARAAAETLSYKGGAAFHLLDLTMTPTATCSKTPRVIRRRWRCSKGRCGARRNRFATRGPQGIEISGCTLDCKSPYSGSIPLPANSDYAGREGWPGGSRPAENEVHGASARSLL